MVAGLVGVLWLASVVFAGSLAAPELDVPKDKAKNQVLTTVLKWKPVAGAKGYRVFVTGNLETLKKSGAQGRLYGLFCGRESGCAYIPDSAKTAEERYSLLLDRSGIQRYEGRTERRNSILYHGIDIFHGYGLTENPVGAKKNSPLILRNMASFRIGRAEAIIRPVADAASG